MNKNYYPLFTRLRSIPFNLNLYLEDINNMSDEEFQEYAEKLRKYVINTYEKHNLHTKLKGKIVC
jgi:predicted metal-binding transcription factor (methanogenesis marker protein 9)